MFSSVLNKRYGVPIKEMSGSVKFFLNKDNNNQKSFIEIFAKRQGFMESNK